MLFHNSQAFESLNFCFARHGEEAIGDEYENGSTGRNLSLDSLKAALVPTVFCFHHGKTSKFTAICN